VEFYQLAGAEMTLASRGIGQRFSETGFFSPKHPSENQSELLSSIHFIWNGWVYDNVATSPKSLLHCGCVKTESN